MRVFFFGDSISFGQGVSPHRVWVTRTAQSLAAELGEDAVEVSNPSVNGNTTRMALERMPMDVQAHKPDLVIVQFGLNDANFWQSDNGCPRVGAASYEANLGEIVQRARAAGVQSIILHTNHLTDEGGPVEGKISPRAPCSYREHTRRYNEAVRRVAAAYNVMLTDIERGWLAAAKLETHALLLPDGLHLSERGHDVYFKIVEPVVKAAAKQLVA